MKRAFAALLAGTVFGMGLGESGMVDPRKVLGFLDVLGRWDPSLMLVMAGAVAVYAAGRRLLLWRGRPWLATDFQLPAGTRIDARLLFGAALFGVGWGWAAIAPDPRWPGWAWPMPTC